MGAATKQEFVQVWETLKTKKISDSFYKEVAKTFNISENAAASSISILKKVACSGSYEDFVTYVESREIPALKLTPSEMEAVKGGLNVYPPRGGSILDWIKDLIKNSTI